MAKLKSHKTPEQIAKKHGVSVSSIQKQLKIGIPIEHEHTKDKDLATDIALQHLGEFPDYYTRLKKMEKSAKNIKEAHEESRYCPLCDKREKRSECSYGENAWDKVSVKDEEYSMARSELKTIDDAVQKLMMKVGKGEGNLEAWVQSKITKAADYIDTAADYVAGGEMEESTSPLVSKIIDEEKKKGLWANIHAKRKRGERPAKPGEKGYPETLDIEEGIEQARKNVGASKCWKNKKLGNPPTKMKGGKEVPNCESVTIQDANGNDYVEFIDLITPEPLISEATTRLQAQTGNLIAVILSWKGKTYSLTMFFPQVKMPSRKEVEYEIQKVYPGSKVLQFNVTTVRGDQPIIQVQNTQSKNYLLNNKNIGEEVELNEISDRKVKAVRNAREKQWNKQFGKKRVQDPTDDMVDKVDRLIDQRNKRTGSKVKKTTMGQLRDKHTKNRLGEEVEISEAKKSEMPCNKPKAEAHGSGETGKSHVVKACEGGKEKLIRFGQKGVKGSPKKKGESKEYASRRHRFQTRHAKNIAKGKMSAAYWANKVKW